MPRRPSFFADPAGWFDDPIAAVRSEGRDAHRPRAYRREQRPGQHRWHRCFVLADHDHLARAALAIHDELPDEPAAVFRYPDRSRVMYEVIDTLERDIEYVVVLVVRDADDPGAIHGGSGADERARQHDRRDF